MAIPTNNAVSSIHFVVVIKSIDYSLQVDTAHTMGARVNRNGEGNKARKAGVSEKGVD